MSVSAPLKAVSIVSASAISPITITIETAFKGAETGNLVIASLPTSDALTTISGSS